MAVLPGAGAGPRGVAGLLGGGSATASTGGAARRSPTLSKTADNPRPKRSIPVPLLRATRRHGVGYDDSADAARGHKIGRRPVLVERGGDAEVRARGLGCCVGVEGQGDDKDGA